VGTEHNKQHEKKKNYNKTMSFESNSNVRKIGRGIALNGRSVCVQALMGDYYRMYDILYQGRTGYELE
jgi:hypothetical protein